MVQWSSLYATRTARMHSSEIRDILRVTERPDVLSLAGGLPAPELFPVEEFREAFAACLSDDEARSSLQYSLTEGYRPLKRQIAERMNRFGINCTADNILITNGSQQALYLIGKIFLSPGDAVVLENPSYLGAIQAWNSFEARYIMVPMDDDGMRTDVLDQILLREKVKFVYVLPNFQNPSGRTMSLERRMQLVEICNRRGVPIVEDDPYGELRYEGERLPNVAALDKKGTTLYLGTFSKILAPGLRLGWVVAPEEVFGMLILAKQPSDLHTDTLSQRVVERICRGDFLDRHIEKIIEVYRERRNALLTALEEYFPREAKWTKAQGGLFVWIELPHHIDARELLLDAIAEKVAFVPGQPFHPDGSGRNTMRLNFSNVPPDKLREAVRRLSVVLHRRMSQSDDVRVMI